MFLRNKSLAPKKNSPQVTPCKLNNGDQNSLDDEMSMAEDELPMQQARRSLRLATEGRLVEVIEQKSLKIKDTQTKGHMIKNGNSLKFIKTQDT